MRLGVALPINAPSGGPAVGSDYAQGAELMERIGFSSLWVFDAIGRGFILPDPLMALTAAATVTTRVELGVGVLQVPLRNVVDTAYRVLTLHHLAQGRLLFGVGAGSTRADFDAFGVPYEERFDRFAAQLPVLRELLATGRHGDTDLTPWPSALGGPPVFLAGWRGPSVRRAATEADGWIASAANTDDDTLTDALKRFRDAGGRRAVITNIRVGADVAPAVDRLRRLRDIGFDDGVALVMRPTEERLTTVLERAA